MTDRAQVKRDLEKLGVKPGDTLFVRAALGSVGRIDGDLYDAVVGGFTDAVGPSGTVMAPAFTKTGNRLSNTKVTFSKESTPYSGAVSKLFLKHPDAVRSSHPSHSFVAIGPRAPFLLQGHGPQSSSFQPVKKLAELDGKMLLLGCNSSSPGFSTVHVAQFDLGLSQKHLVRHLLHSEIIVDGKPRDWTPIEAPGCSASFDKFYPAYLKDNNLVTGYIGEGFSLLVPSTKKALAADKLQLEQNPRFSDCEKTGCLTCGLRLYQPHRIPLTLLAAIWHRLILRKALTTN